MLKLDKRLLSAVESAYLHLLDRFGVLKGDVLAALVICHLALSPLTVPVVAFKMVCLISCLQLSSLQRSHQLRLVNATADWLRRMPVLRLVMTTLAIVHVARDPSIKVVAAQVVALAAAYLFCAKVRQRRVTERRLGAFRPDFA
jgi:hypothetical protein